MPRYRGQPAQAAFAENERELLSRRQLIALSFLWFALSFHFAALLPIVVPMQVLQFVTPGVVGSARQAVFLGVLTALGALMSLVLQPAVGALSDRTRTRLGRRRPYIAAGGIMLLGGLIMLALAHEVVPFVAGLFLVVVANTVSGAAYQGLVPDRVPASQRGIAAGYIGLMSILGTIGSLTVASLLLGHGQAHGWPSLAGIQLGASLYYALGAGVVLTGLVVTLLSVHEESRPSAPAQRIGGVSFPRGRSRPHWLAAWRHPNFVWVLLARSFTMLGLMLFMTFVEYYLARVAHIATFLQTTASNTIMALVGALSITVVLGHVSDRMRRRVPLICGATALMALVAMTFVVAPGRLPLWPLGLMFGIGYGGFTSVNWALAIDALPSTEEAGKDLGVWSMAATLPTVFAPALGSLVIAGAGRFGQTALGYRAVFALATLSLIVGAICVSRVRESWAPRPDGAGTPRGVYDKRQ